MPAIELREIDRFPARSDDGSRKTTIVLFQYMVSTAVQAELMPGMKHAETVDGETCERLDDDTFRLSATGVIVRRVKSENP
jgi:hypothetical protein